MIEAKLERPCRRSGKGRWEGPCRIRESHIFNFLNMKILQFFKKDSKCMLRHMLYEALGSYAPCYKDYAT